MALRLEARKRRKRSVSTMGEGEFAKVIATRGGVPGVPYHSDSISSVTKDRGSLVPKMLGHSGQACTLLSNLSETKAVFSRAWGEPEALAFRKIGRSKCFPIRTASERDGKQGCAATQVSQAAAGPTG